MNRRRHEAAPPIDWSIDASGGPLQGPLALAFLDGREMVLHLQRGQVALLLDAGRLRATYAAGGHALRIGDGDGDIAPRCHLLFLDVAGGLPVRWTAEAPLRCGPGGDIAVVGGARLDVADPAAFHAAFLAGAEVVDAGLVLALADRLLQAAVAARLAASSTPTSDGAPSAWTPASLQARLTTLRESDLADDLAPCGLSCRELAAYTAAPPVERAPAATEASESGEALPMSGHSDHLRRH